jgi:hypothetical protein
MMTSSEFAFKDYFPIIIMAITVISSHLIVTKQVRKNTRSLWIQDFRKEIANFLALAQYITPKSSDEQLLELTRSAFQIAFLFNPDNTLHKELEVDVFNMVTFLSIKTQSFDITKFKQDVNKIRKLTIEILQVEKRLV